MSIKWKSGAILWNKNGFIAFDLDDCNCIDCGEDRCLCLYCWVVLFNCTTKLWGTPTLESVQKFGSGCGGSTCGGGAGSGPVPGPNGEAWGLDNCTPVGSLRFTYTSTGATIGISDECPEADPNTPPAAPVGIDPTDPGDDYYQDCLDGVIAPCGQL